MNRAISELSYLFRADKKNRPLLLLGAGASFRSGIPLAADLVKLIAKAAYARHVKGVDWRHSNIMPSDWLPYLQQQKWFISDAKKFAENFPLAVQNLLQPLEFRRDFFIEVIQPPNGINSGYRHLAKIMMRGLSSTILTPNFDSLLVDALRELYPHVKPVFQINRTKDDLVAFNIYNRYQVVYLHGAVEYYRDKNLIEETRRLDEELVGLVRPLLRDSPLIVIGYRGAEPSIMNHLLEEGIDSYHAYPHGIYWCVRKGDNLHENVLRLQDKLGANFQLLEIEGFDELMEALDSELQSDALYYSPSSKPPIEVPGADWDSHLMKNSSFDELDNDLILVTLQEYCDRLKLPPIDQHNYISLLKEQGLLVERDGKLIPTRGCYLLFARDLNSRFPYARVALTRDKRRIVFEGNLLRQYRELVNYLMTDDVNPILRVKGEETAEDQSAYPHRALVELVINMLSHRDYQVEDHCRIEYKLGQYLRFSNPGGLLPKVLNGVQREADGRFYPVRGKTDIRNPQLADIFFGIGTMDKAGSGLPDVLEMMAEHGGRAEFFIDKDNQSLTATLFQALQQEPEISRTARRVSPFDVYVTNLLPFRLVPKMITILPLSAAPAQNGPLFRQEEVARELPIFIRHGEQIITFADLRAFPEFAERRGRLIDMSGIPLEQFVKDRDHRSLVVWLLAKHWSFFLRRWKHSGLNVEPKQNRAFFQLVDGDRNSVVYDSRHRKGVKRDIVKRRGEGKIPWHENEGIAYEIVEPAPGRWAIQLKPFYMFTASDGRTPLPPFERTRRATRRIKFDRTKNVDDDLTFWARFLSSGQPTMNLGCVGVDDLILDSEYVSEEVPRHPGGLSSDPGQN